MSKQDLFWIGAGAALVVLAMAARGAQAAGEAVNPLNNDNIFYRGINAVGDRLDDGGDNDSWYVSDWLSELTGLEAKQEAILGVKQ